MGTGAQTLHLPPEFSLILGQTLWQPQEPRRGRFGAGTSPSPAHFALWVPLTESSAPAHPPGWDRRRGHRNPPFSQNPGPSPGPGDSRQSFAPSPHLSIHPGVPGRSPCPGQGCLILHQAGAAQPPSSAPNSGSIQAGAEAPPDLTRSPCGPAARKMLCPGILRAREATTSHQAKPSMQQSPERERRLYSGCPRRSSGSWSILENPCRTNGLWHLG